MAEKRRHRRYSKRLKVDWGEQDFANQGVTHDISKSGAFVISGKLPRIGQTVHIKITGDAGKWFACEGVVRWAKEIPPQLRQVQRGGFGVRFMLPDELVEALIPHLKSEQIFEVAYKTPQELHHAYKVELRHGGIFVRTDKVLALQQEVSVEFQLEFAQRTIEAAGKVMQVMPASAVGSTVAGLAIVFVDPGQLLRRLEDYLPAGGR
jgi:type IV pilus assembly protein PilZ